MIDTSPLLAFSLGVGVAAVVGTCVLLLWRRFRSRGAAPMLPSVRVHRSGETGRQGVERRRAEAEDLYRQAFLERYLRQSVEAEVQTKYDWHLLAHSARNPARRLLAEWTQVGLTAKRMEEIVEEKRNKFLNIPSTSFHYVNKDQVINFYNDYFGEPTVASLVSEIIGETSGEIKASLPQILESKLGGKDLTKWVSTIKLPDTSLNGMFLKYQRETIKSGQVTLGIEEVDVELTELQALEGLVAELWKNFELRIDENLLSGKRARLKEKAAERTLSKLEQTNGWVLVEGKFEIDSEGEFYKCTYIHPVSEYLSSQIGPVTISVIVRQDALEPHVAGNYKQSVGRLIPMRIYGQVWQPIDRKTGIWDLQLTPLAIY